LKLKSNGGYASSGTLALIALATAGTLGFGMGANSVDKVGEVTYETVATSTPAPTIVTNKIPEVTKVSETKTDVTKSAYTKTKKVKVKVKKKDSYLYTQTTLNVRKSYSKDSKKLGVLNTGTKIHVVGSAKGWYQIEFKKSKAWVSSDYVAKESPLLKVSSTAYWDEYHRRSASGRKLTKGYSIAGKVAWLNKSCYIYKCNDDGSVGECLGYYSFDDTGYGAESGVGSSKILSGRSIGTIENGTCIDFFMNNESECQNYGRRNVYIQVVD
jgi:uncharacterized protein YraI